MGVHWAMCRNSTCVDTKAKEKKKTSIFVLFNKCIPRHVTIIKDAYFIRCSECPEKKKFIFVCSCSCPSRVIRKMVKHIGWNEEKIYFLQT